MPEAFLSYVPVYHRGYELLLTKYPQIDTFFLINGKELPSIFPIKKDLHALDVQTMARILGSLGRLKRVEVAGEANLPVVRRSRLVVPWDEAVDWWLETHAIPARQVTRESVFLRWTRAQALRQREVIPDTVTSSGDADLQDWARQARACGEQSSDWWRRVGAVLRLEDGGQIAAYNRHLPHPQTPYMVGDIRGQFHRGEHWELGSSIHAEAAVIARAAREGVTTAGAQLLVTDFPCPNCAKLVAASGIRRLYFLDGYTLADGREILAAAGVEVVRVATELPQNLQE